jgi:hypothetical protein
MSTYPGAPVPAKRKPVLTWIGLACLVVGAIVTGVFVWRIVQTAPRSPQPIDDGTVRLMQEGLTIYASVPVLPPQCEAQDADGNDVPLEHPAGSETITINDESWYVVARSADAVPAGVYSVSCTDDQTSATYAVGARTGVLSFVLSIFGAIGSFLVFLILGIVFLTVGVVRNRRRNRPANTFPTANDTFQTGNDTFPQYRPGPNPDRPEDR